jgi:hypothetical protein
MKNRISKRLIHLQNELRKRALKEKDPELRADFWRLYYAALDIQHDITELVMAAEIRRLAEIMLAYGITDTSLGLDDTPPADEPEKPDSEPPDHEDDIPPRQKGLWD